MRKADSRLESHTSVAVNDNLARCAEVFRRQKILRRFADELRTSLDVFEIFPAEMKHERRARSHMFKDGRRSGSFAAVFPKRFPCNFMNRAAVRDLGIDGVNNTVGGEFGSRRGRG